MICLSSFWWDLSRSEVRRSGKLVTIQSVHMTLSGEIPASHPLRYRLHKRAHSGHMAQIRVSKQPELGGEGFNGLA